MVSLSLEVVPLAYMLRKLAGGRGKERKQKRERRAGSSGGERWREVGPLPICRGSVPVGVGRKRKERRTESVERAAVAARGGASAYMPGLPVGLGGRGEEENGERAARSSAGHREGKMRVRERRKEGERENFQRWCSR